MKMMSTTTPPRHRPPQLPPSSLRNKPSTTRRISNPMAYSTITPSKSRTPPPPPIQTFQSPPNINESNEVALDHHHTDIYEGYLQPSDDTSYNNSNDDLIPLTTVWPSLLSSTFSQEEKDTNNLECNYDINPTILYQNIQSKQWSSVIQRAKTHPNEVSTWVSRTELNSTKLRWRLLPLHAALIFHAPYDVIKCLCDVESTNDKYGYSVTSCDDQGKLPLHLCLRKNNSNTDDTDNSMTNLKKKLKVIELLVNIYPESLSIKDNKGRTPIMLVHKLSEYEQDLYMNLFDNINMKDEDTEESEEKEDMRGIITVQTGDDIPSMSTSQIPWMPRAPPEKQQRQSRMDEELLRKLHRRRNKEDEYEMKKRQGTLEDHEEGMEVVYNVDKMPMKSTLPPPPPPPGPPPPPLAALVHLKKEISEEKEDTTNDVKLLQKFHTQRVKKEDPPVSRDSSIDYTLSATPNNKYKDKITNDNRAQSKSKSFINMSDKMNKDPRISAMRERLRSRIKTESTENSMSIDKKERKKQSTYTESKKQFKDTKQQKPCVKEEDENITVTSSICSSTTGSVVSKNLHPYKSNNNTPDPPFEQEEHDSGVESLSVNNSKQDMNKNDIIRDSNKKLDGYHEDSMKDMLQALTKSFSLNDEYSVDQLSGKSIAKKDTYGETKRLDLYTSNTLITAPTDDMTEEDALRSKCQSDSHSPSEVYTSLVYKVNTKDETTDANQEEADDSLDTPKLLMRLNKLKSKRFFTSPEGTNNITNDLATPNLMMQADKFFSSTPRKDEEEVVENEREKVEEDTSVASSITHTKFDQIMAKYAMESDKEKLASESSKDKPVDNREEILNMKPQFLRSDSNHNEEQSVRSSNPYPARLNKQQASEYNTPSYLTSTDSYQNNIKSISFRKIAPVNSMDSDAVSTLSKNTGITTLGPISIATDDSSVIESYVQSIVEQVLSKEVESAGTMKRELESALRSKMKLGRKVKKLITTRDDQSLELKRAIESKHIQQDKFQREMEIHLTRKASELHEAMKQALNQAEEAKTRALHLAKRDMDNEVSLLRRQIKDLQTQNNEVHIDRALHNALELVETNQQALRYAAEKDVLSTLQMKEEIEQSFISAVGQFEKWTDKQLELMEEKWRSLR